MKIVRSLIYILAAGIFLYGTILYPANAAPESMKIDKEHVKNWNTFFNRVYALHLYQLSQYEVYTKESTGGYAGQPEFYREIKYYHTETDQLLSRIQWETDNPQQIHVIETYVYDSEQKLKNDYLVAFLPKYRNAPIQTLINLHYHDSEFDSYRQFDASGNRIYEECKGKFFEEPIYISLMDDDFYSIEPSIEKIMSSEAYLFCFEHLPVVVGDNINPVARLTLPNKISIQAGVIPLDTAERSNDDIYQIIDQLSQKIETTKNPAPLYIERGKAYFTTHQFERATADYSRALTIDDTQDEAYFGRGLSYGREGKIKQGIKDLTIYIERNPGSSVAYTKRGVRNIWAGQFNEAENDLKKAIELDPENAEAHDDLGVLYARKENYERSIHHFQQVVKIDSSYLKGFHNLALSYHIIGKDKLALKTINRALNLSKNEKDSLLLKSEILIKLNMPQEAQNIIEQAEFLPDGNWSERFSMQPEK